MAANTSAKAATCMTPVNLDATVKVAKAATVMDLDASTAMEISLVVVEVPHLDMHMRLAPGLEAPSTQKVITKVVVAMVIFTVVVCGMVVCSMSQRYCITRL